MVIATTLVRNMRLKLSLKRKWMLILDSMFKLNFMLKLEFRLNPKANLI